MRRIDADELKTAIEDRIDHIPSNDYDEGWNAALNTAIDEIDNAPTVKTSKVEHKAYNEGFKDGVEQGIKLSERPQDEWIPIETRELTEEEKEEYPDATFMYDCKLPEDGEEVLVTTWSGDVSTDTFCRDDGCYFESYCDEGDVIAWMPKPKPYKEGGEEE